MKKILTWILTIVAFIFGIACIIYIVNPHKFEREDIKVDMTTYETVYNHGVEVTVGYDFPYVGYDIQQLHVRITFYSETGEMVRSATVLLQKNHKVDIQRYDINHFPHQKLPVKVEVEDVSADILMKPYIFLMVISFVVGLVGLWKIVFAPLKEKWY